MSADDNDSAAGSGDMTKPLMIGAGVVLVLVLLLSFFTLLLVVDLRNEAIDGAEHARKAFKATKAIEDALAEMRKTAPAPKAGAPSPQPTHVDAADTSSDCVIRAGSGKGLADCIKSAPQ